MAKKRVNAIGHSLDLLDMTTLNLSILKDLAVRWGDQGVRVGIKWSDTGLQCTVEESCKVWEDVQIGFSNFVEAVTKVSVSDPCYLRSRNLLDTENERVKLEARYTQVVWDRQFVESSPKSRYGLERQGGHDLDLPLYC